MHARNRPEYSIFLNKKITFFGKIYFCSGHAGKSDLEYAIKAINPDILIPIHTQNPEEFKKIHGDVRIVRRGETVKI
jgi:ribonuclease J